MFKKMKKQNTQKGITLVALIITIIILIILAGITLSIALGNNGIFKKSQKAVDEYQKQAKAEQGQLDSIYGELAKLNGEPSYIPEGFEHTEGTLEDGYVIKNTETEDEFVWIPVETPILDLSSEYNDLNDTQIKEKVQAEIDKGKYPMAIKKDIEKDTEEDIEGNYIGVLYDFNLDVDKVKIEPNSSWKPTSNSSGYREPDVIHYYEDDYDEWYANDTNQGITQENLQKEYNKLVQSVIVNGGFYIGRYESGFEGNNKAVSKKDEQAENLGSKTWYEMYNNQKNIYTDNSAIKTNMIWGSQWDQLMIYLKDVPNNNEGATKPFFILDSTGMGNYNGSEVGVVATGSENDCAVKRIYGLAGNVWDWTMGAYNSGCRVVRGGSYVISTSDRRASRRYDWSPTTLGNHIGSRLTLYK